MLTAIVISGCNHPFGNKATEGVIEYAASPVDKNSPFAAYAPSKMSFKFKDSKCRGELSAGMGILTTVFISDPDQMKVIQLIRVLRDKSAHVFNANDVQIGRAHV